MENIYNNNNNNNNLNELNNSTHHLHTESSVENKLFSALKNIPHKNQSSYPKKIKEI
jgi:hypothetical protein